MPQLKQATNDIKQFMLPSTSSLPEADQAWVKMDVGQLLGGDVMDMLDGEKTGAGTLSCNMLASRIKEWNYTKPDGTPEDITAESVRRLDVQDLTYLLNQFNMPSGSQLGDKKKLN